MVRLRFSMMAFAALAGLALTLGFAPFHLWPLALAGVALWAWLVQQAPTQRHALRLTVTFGLVHGATALYWLPWAFWHDSNSLLFAVLGGIPATLGLALWVSLGYLLAAALAWPWRATPRFWWVWGSVVFGTEILRQLTPFGFPWLPLGAVWIGHNGPPTLAQTAAVGGVPLLTLLLLAQAGLVASLKPWAWRVTALLLALQWVSGTVRLQRPLDTSGPTVRIVQPNLAAGLKWDPVARWAFLNDSLAVATMPSQASPSLVILPETGIPFVLAEEPVAAARLAQALGPTPLLAGVLERTPTTQGFAYFNSLALIEGGQLQGSVHKQLLVPFGEFIPLRGLIEPFLPQPLRTFSQARIDFTPGQHPPLLATPLGPMVGLICYEGIFAPFVGRQSGDAVALLNVTNDAWFTGTSALYQHAALQRLRAIETGLPLLRSANTGISFATDGMGRILAQLPPNQAGTLEVVLPRPLLTTPWHAFLTTFFK